MDQVLYEESNVKGLDLNLLRLNRQRIEKEKSMENQDGDELAGDGVKKEIPIKPKKFETLLGRQLYTLLMTSRSVNNSKKKSFCHDRMVFEFDTSHDFLKNRFKEYIPTTILRSAEDCVDDNVKFSFIKN